MRKLLPLALILCLLACQEKPTIPPGPQEEIVLTQHEIDSILQEFKFKYEKPVILKNSEHVLIPISTKLLDNRSKFYKASSSYDYDYSESFPRYWNMLFYNRKTGNTELLTAEKYRISKFEANLVKHYDPDNETDYQQVSSTLKGKILYIIGDTDYNGDNKLNHKDPEQLFVSDTDGANLKRISPIHEDLSSYDIVPNSNQIILKTLRDTNKDYIFDDQDEYVWYKTEIVDNNWQIEEMINASERKNIENLYFEQWLKNK